METFKSDISGKDFPVSERISGKSIRQAVLEQIQKDVPGFTPDSYLAVSELNRYRKKYITDSIGKQIGEVTDLETKVLQSINNQTTLTDKIDDGEDATNLTFGQRVADHVATFGGSWTFIISFLAFLLIWIAVNALWLVNESFDPYPFILLNLILSCVAALQAPVIMMSQNRQETKDRERAKKDYMVNLKSELEIRILHEKIDHLMLNQQQEILEVQKIQIEMLSDILEEMKQDGCLKTDKEP